MSSVLRSRTIRQLAATTDPPADAGTIDLMGWDTVFALSLEALNASIRTQNTTPASFHGADLVGGATVDGAWDAWSVNGGEGEGILMKCPVRTGTLTVGPDTPPITLNGGYVEVEITLKAEAATTDVPDTTAQPGSGQTHQFTADGTSSDPFQQPTVQSVNFVNISGLARYAAQAAFQAYFNNHLSDFNAVFAAVRLEEEAVEKDRQWLKPQVSLYAMASAGSSGDRRSYFGLLSLTSPLGRRPVPQQNFDLRMFDYFPPKKNPSEIAGHPTNSVFAVSGPLAMQNMIISSATYCVKGASVENFGLINNGITVVNKDQLGWGDFQWDADNPDSTVTPVIAPGNLQLTLDGANFHLLVSQAAFTTPDGACDVEITTDQFFTFGATKLNDGKYYFTPGPGLGTNSVRASVTANKGFEIASIISSVVVGVALGFLGGVIGASLAEAGAVSGAVTEGAEAAVQGTADAIAQGVENMSPEAANQAAESAVSEAGQAIASNGENVAAKAGMFANKFKIWGGVLGGMLAIPIGLLPQIMTEIYSGQITTGNVPTMDEFATNFTHSVQWPEVRSWELTGGTFAGAFLLGGHAS